MPLKIVRNDITKMNTEAIVNTANDYATVGTGCDYAVYMAAGVDALLKYREEKIGFVPEGEAFITPGFKLQAKYIIHAVSPLYMGGDQGEEGKLRSCYRKSLQLAKEHNIKSISFPLISTGGFGYPKEEGMRIAVDEINAFLLENEMQIYLVVFDTKATMLGEKIYPDLEAYIDHNYVKDKRGEEYGTHLSNVQLRERRTKRNAERADFATSALSTIGAAPTAKSAMPITQASIAAVDEFEEDSYFDFEEQHESKLEERMKHISDTFSQYLMYLIQDKKMENAEVYKRAIVDKKIFSKIKNNVDYHPQKITALCLCVGAKLNLDESKDLLARAGYALSPCDKTDIIFSYFIENEIYDMIELDIQLEEHGLPCIIS
uniref:macro domain-containing protein n=1 Tax=Acetatifactor sp. TaxID=1872090 RepID=UPI004056E1F8